MTYPPPLIQNWHKPGAWDLRGMSLAQYAFLIARAGAGSIWTPAVKATLFQDVAGTQPVTASGQGVALMLDVSGAGRNATQATPAFRPQYVETAGAGRIVFDGANDYLEVPVFLPGGAPSIVVASVTTPPAVSGNDTFFSQRNGTGAGTQPIALNLFFGSAQSINVNMRNSVPQALIVSPGPVYALGARALIGSRYAIGSGQARLNGASVTVAQTLPAPPYTGLDAGAFGAERTNGAYNNYFAGEMFGAFAMPAAISDGDLLLIERYIASLAGLVV